MADDLMTPISEDSSRKRVASTPSIGGSSSTNCRRCTLTLSAISSILMLVVFIMDRVIRAQILLSYLSSKNPQIHAQYRMKPTRIRMCHSLVMNYGLYKKMEIFVRGSTSPFYLGSTLR